MELASAGTDQVTSISLLTAAMEVNNAICHALEETPLGIKEYLLLPLCDRMKSFKDGVYKQIQPSMVFYKALYGACAARNIF